MTGTARRRGGFAVLSFALGAGLVSCGSTDAAKQVGGDSAPVVADSQAAAASVRVTDVRATFLPEGMIELAPGAATGESAPAVSGGAGLLPPVSAGEGAPTGQSPPASAGGSTATTGSAVDSTGGARFSRIWAGPATGPVTALPIISVAGFTIGTVPPQSGSASTPAGSRTVALAERAEADGTAYSATWDEGDVTFTAKARKVDRDTFVRVLAGLQAVTG